MSRRIEDMRRMLGDTETRLLNYKTEHNLVGLHDKAITERRTNEATEVLTAAENREAQARARLKQLEAGPASMGGVAALGNDPESRQLLGLIEGRAAARAEVEQYAATLGERHPALAAAREKARDFDRRVEQSVAALRHTARSQLAEAQAQTAALTKKLADLAQEMSKARESDVSLQQLEDAVEGKRKALTALEARQRDANDMSHVEGVAFRIVSPARIPNTQGGIVGVALWTLCGGLIGAALALAGLAATAIFEAPAAAILEAPAAVIEAPAAASSGLDWFEPAASRPAPECVEVLPAITPAAGRRLSPVDAMQEVERRPDRPFAQAVEALYLRLTKSRSDAAGPLVVLVAGTEPLAGASTLAANLARVAAAHGQRTLLIDAHQAHPVLDLMIPASAPNTLIELAGLERPLYRLEPFSQSLSLIPALANEKAVCRVIAEQSAYRRIAGLKGNFDFVVFDGPDAGNAAALRALVPVAAQVLLVAPAASDEAGLPQLLRRIGVEPGQFFACLRAAPRRQAQATSRAA
jgi:Mrp family chromosome partitioning ATPase